MPALNHLQLIGHLGRDPETRVTTTGKKVCHFSLAVNGRAEGEVEWFQVEAWERLGEVCQEYLAKGRLAYVDGRVHLDRWTDDKGEAHSRLKLVARNMQVLDRRPEEKEVAADVVEA